jgi:4-amino-4-deoxy-L-arabinose transferase-like glycosyltransferase
MNGQNQLKRWLTLGLFLVAAYFPLFLHLDSQVLENFDESFFALRAYHIATTGEYLYHYNQLPDGPAGTNLKPPLISGVQALFFKMLGFNELALRLPIALIVLTLLLLMIRLGRQHFRDPALGYFSAMILLTSWGFIHVHVSRTGDHDAPLAAFGWLALMSLYLYLEGERKNPRWMYGLMAALIAATLTKSVAGLFFAPGMFLYVLYKREFLHLLRDRHFWFAVGGYVVVVAGYYLFREWDHPGFLTDVGTGELGGHYLKTRDGHQWPYWWFAERLVTLKYQWWIGWFLAGGILAFHPRLRHFRDLAVLLWLAWLSWMLVISGSQTKLEWYDASLYPVMAMMGAIVLSVLYQALLDWLGPNSVFWRYLVSLLFISVLFLPPYVQVFKKVYRPQDINHPGERYGELMEQVARDFPAEKNYTIVYRSYSFHALFYQLVYNQQKGYEISRKRKFEEMKEGETVMLCEKGGLAYARKHFKVENISAKDGCFIMRLLKRKEDVGPAE